MKEGERCTVLAPGYYGRTGLILCMVQRVDHWFLEETERHHPYVRFDGGGSEYFAPEQVVPQSRNYDYDWLRERNLL